MTTTVSSACSAFLIAVLVVAVATVSAQTASDFPGEPDKSMASAQESFAKGEKNKAAEHIEKAATWVRKESDKVAKDAKQGVKKAGKVSADEIGKFFKGLGDGITDLGKKLSG